MSDTAWINIPGKFCDWFEGTNLASGADDVDPECKETRIAYEEGKIVKSANGGYYIRVLATATVLKVLNEYASSCLEVNVDDPQKSEIEAARKVKRRVFKEQQLMKENAK